MLSPVLDIAGLTAEASFILPTARYLHASGPTGSSISQPLQAASGRVKQKENGPATVEGTVLRNVTA